MEAVIKSAASAASRKTKSREQRSREAPRPAAVRLPSRRPGASLDLGPEDVVFLEAALAAGLITACKSKQGTSPKSQKHRKGFPKVSKNRKGFPNLFKPFQNLSRAPPRSENPQLSKTFENDEKWHNSAHTHPNPTFLMGN